MASAREAPLPMDVLRYRNDREVELKEENEMWLERHPEVGHILTDFVCAVLAEQPDDIFSFARSHFGTPVAGGYVTDSSLDCAEPSPAKAAASAPAAEVEAAAAEEAAPVQDEPAPAAEEQASQEEDSAASREDTPGVNNEAAPAAADDPASEEGAPAPPPLTAEAAAEPVDGEAPWPDEALPGAVAGAPAEVESQAAVSGEPEETPSVAES